MVGSGHTPQATPAAMAAPSTVISLKSGRTEEEEEEEGMELFVHKSEELQCMKMLSNCAQK